MSKKKYKQRVVILGAGFAGIQVARILAKTTGDKTEIILVDEHDVHIYTPDLYEIATAFHQEINAVCLTKLRETVATPINSLIDRRRVTFIQSRVSKILPSNKTVQLKKDGDLSYDYLVLTLGSVTNYYNIPGLEKYAQSLKTINDAIAINCHIDQHFHKLWLEKENRQTHIVIGGGGFTGVEFAAELPGYIKKLCKKYHYPIGAVAITIVEGNNYLLGRDEHTSKIVEKRLHDLGIKIRTSTKINEVTEKSVLIKGKNTENKIDADIVIWTGGVAPNPIVKESFKKVEKNGGLAVNEYLQSKDFPEIFAAGDNAVILDGKSEKPAPMLAQLAFDQGKIIAKNICAKIRKKKMKKYKIVLRGFIIPMGGKYALFKRKNRIFKGHWCWILRRLVDLKYALSILPFVYAVKKWLHDTNVFIEND